MTDIPSLIQNLSSLLIVYDDGQVLEVRLVYIDRDAAHSRRSFRKDEPFTLLIGEVDKVSLVVYLEIQFNSPLFVSPKS